MGAEATRLSGPCSIPTGNVRVEQPSFFPTLCVSENDPESAASIGFGVTDTILQVGEFVCIESMNGEHGPHFASCWPSGVLGLTATGSRSSPGMRMVQGSRGVGA